MKKNTIYFNVDYQKLDILEEFNSENIKYPIVLSSPHAGTIFPEEFLANSNLNKDELRESEDLYVTELIKPTSEQGIPLISLNIHRTFIDVNRGKNELDDTMFFDKPQSKKQPTIQRCRFGLGIIHRVVSQNKNIYDGQISYKETEIRIKTVYDFYHKRLQKLVDRVKQKFGFCLLIDCHSMTSKICSVMNEKKTVDFSLGTLFGESCPKEMALFFQKALEAENYRVEMNRPYSGAFTTLSYSQPTQNIFTLQLEINKATYSDEAVYKKNDDFQKISQHLSDSILSLGNFLLDFK